MKNLLFIIAVGTLVLFSIASAAGQSQSSQTKTIDSYVRSLESLRRKSPHQVFADVADYDQEGSKWQRFRSAAALEKHREKSEAYTIAYVWTKTGKVVGTNFTHFSPSGDWTEYVFAYYRPDGTLSRADVDFRTFYGDLMVLQKIYFDKEGNVIKRTKRSMDLMTKKPKKVSGAFASDSDLQFGELYKRTDKLPFASLIK